MRNLWQCRAQPEKALRIASVGSVTFENDSDIMPEGRHRRVAVVIANDERRRRSY
ncbi:hypothetical protein HYPSUDRAFT_39572 [Hypholoma sublateritium FD-334 SS-4]|uniref:Uncharacterized protein n=1 Tax=Hypholoma sublateritium (strain FD-334 SS-4) TaxID=945553 RepID=A0A0D2NYE1_HYPSF|nr:hypothetical protein HYPSUDRAFT_39572 [Hypholoma sublateritium FD-334 SS-4]